MTGTDSGAPGAGGARTAGEIIEGLDGQLNDSMAVFDGMILTERAAAAAMADSALSDGSTAGAGGHDGDGDEGDFGGSGPLFEEGDLSEGSGIGGQGGDAVGDAGGGGIGGEDNGMDGEQPGTVAAMPGGPGLSGKGKGDGTVPPDLVDGSDDDIVARQIREAAINEKDPALREKLWDEYRKYKRGS
ncbi:MAG: hypothetical protein WC247_11300 [Porticoccaceae bacterium]